MSTNKNILRFAFPAVALAACTFGPSLVQAQTTTTGIECSQIASRHVLEQDNMRAGLTLIQCGVVQGGKPGGDGREIEGDAPQPPNVLVSNRTCSGSSSCTHSESMVWKSTKAGDNTVVVNYNDETNSGGDYSGVSYSTDGGNTFTQIVPSPFGTGHGTNYGDPLVVYNSKLQMWFAGDLASGCGGFGLGSWSSPDGQNWTTAACIHNGNDDDRPSMWVDNNPFSLKYGRMYVSFNNFNVDGGALFVTHSDDGVNWVTPVQLSTAFIRDVQITGTPPGPPPPNAGYTSTVFSAAMDEGGGGLATRQNIMFRSSDGGVTWTEIMVGSRFNPPGDGVCASNSYFAKMNPIWRHMGWGEPGVGPSGVVHYAYAGAGAISTGDIFYTRSTDNGTTWSTPIVLNDPETNQYQSHWMPSLSVNYNLAAFTPPQDVTVSWYDRRQATTACNVATDPGCSYQRYGIQSNNNGATWGSNFAVSTQIIPQPAQDDPYIQSCYAGDYDYSTAQAANAYVTWTDGRVSIGGVNVQDVEGAVVPEP
jgi:hypothetical protein